MKLGILGGGQLGRMLALSAHPLGVETLLVDPSPSAPAGQVSDHLVADYADDEALERLAACDAVTFEFENVPEEAARRLAQTCPVRPTPNALLVAQDRLVEKGTFVRLGIETPRHFAVDSLDDLQAASSALGGNLVLQTRRFGYDGKGQCVIRSGAGLDEAFRGLRGAPAIAEELIAFDREVSVLACRDLAGAIAFYPVTENHHVGGILRTSIAPAPATSLELSERAFDFARRLLEDLDYVGVLALELFQAGDRLLANEFAPRVHNSGHWTIEGARTSQFENHVRAVCGLPLGATEAPEPTAMINLIGALPPRGEVLAVTDAHLHEYGKAPRPGRKVGHVTVRGKDEAELRRRINAVEALLA